VLIALATDSLLLFMWLEEMEFTPYVLVFMPLWCWSVWALCLLVRNRSWKEIPQPKRFAAGVVATALLTGTSLAYSTMYQPAAAPMHLTEETKARQRRGGSYARAGHRGSQPQTGPKRPSAASGCGSPASTCRSLGTSTLGAVPLKGGVELANRRAGLCSGLRVSTVVVEEGG
jgi:hypothetical protein